MTSLIRPNFKHASLFCAALLAATVAATVALAAGAQNSTPAPPKPAPAAKSSESAPPSDKDPVLTPAAAEAIQKRVESFLRDMFAWGPDFTVKPGPVKNGPIDGLYQILVTVTNQGQSDAATVYVSKNGRYMFRGDVQDLTANPQADLRRQIQTAGYASKGPANAKVDVVEYGDFECPSCRQLEYVLRVVLPKYPQIRYVFKDFPLTSIHPWAMTAALAGHCALKQSSDIFWKFHDKVYDDQDAISVENANTKLADIATAAGADPATYQACMTDPKTADQVKKSTAEAQKLEITGTPTTFVNGRRLTGPDQSLLEQYIKFDLTPKP
jgi:protein-disulfide isomerase